MYNVFLLYHIVLLFLFVYHLHFHIPFYLVNVAAAVDIYKRCIYH